MSEYELAYMATESINLAYRAGEYWVALTAALVAAMFFAADRIPLSLLVVLIALYLTSTFGTISESYAYGIDSEFYLLKLADLRGTDVRAMSTLFVSSNVTWGSIGNVTIQGLASIFASLYAVHLWRQTHRA
jgi:hypothetical protein